MEKTVFKTAWAYALETALKYGISPSIPTNSTLNEALGISADLTLAPGEKPKVQYLAIGAGAKTVNCTSGTAITNYAAYSADQVRLYKHLPFILRPVNNDLSTAEAVKYRMRKVIDIGGTNYVAYYLKVLVTNAMAIEFESVTIPASGPRVSTPYNTSAAMLNPTPPTAAELAAAGNNYLSTHAFVNASLTEAEVTEIKDASAIINGGVADEYLTELAIVSGVDKQDQITINGNSVNYTEAAKAQINEIIRIDKSIIFGNPDFDINLSAGALDPIYG